MFKVPLLLFVELYGFGADCWLLVAAFLSVGNHTTGRLYMLWVRFLFSSSFCRSFVPSQHRIIVFLNHITHKRKPVVLKNRPVASSLHRSFVLPPTKLPL